MNYYYVPTNTGTISNSPRIIYGRLHSYCVLPINILVSILIVSRIFHESLQSLSIFSTGNRVEFMRNCVALFLIKNESLFFGSKHFHQKQR